MRLKRAKRKGGEKTTMRKETIIEHLGNRVHAVGFAPVERFSDAPENHHPSNACKNANTVITFGITVPRGMLRSPDYRLHMLHSTYHNVYRRLDELSLELSNFIESSGNHLAVPIPSYAPLVFHGREPWGVVSLKHAAAKAGLGSFGRSGLVYHPSYGALLRLGGVVTSAEIEGDPATVEMPCPPSCAACHKICPSGAFDEEGNFNKLTCLAFSIRHVIYPLALNDEQGRKNIETVINTGGHNYWLKCTECLRVCPLHLNPDVE